VYVFSIGVPVLVIGGIILLVSLLKTGRLVWLKKKIDSVKDMYKIKEDPTKLKLG